MIKNLAGAKRYVDNIKKKLITNPFADRDGLFSLRYLARAKDEENFRIIVKIMVTTIKTQKNFKLFRKEPLAFVESLCMMEDNGEKEGYNAFQAGRGLKVKRLPIGKTQRFFQKLYGDYFFNRKGHNLL